VSAIVVRGLRKSYGEHEAVRGISFDIREGEVFGLLGPNGAGKTTTVEILEGYRERDDGEVDVLGFDPARAERAYRERIGVVLQQSQLFPNLTVAETHRMFAGYYSHPRDVDEVIDLVGLGPKRDARAKTLSSGQKRRLDLGVALVGDPDLVFLDEPTTGFDPAARRAAWEMIRSLRSLGKTIVLTTHYLDEAEQLADRVAVMRDGQIEQVGRPREIYEAPTSRFVADFIGTSNFIDGVVQERENGVYVVRTEDGDLRVRSEADFSVGAQVVVSARPEHIGLAAGTANGKAPNRWYGRVEARAFLGESVDHVVSVGSREIRARCNPSISIPAPTEVTITFAEDACSLIPGGE
jgi:ABC-2 type transport system ATP-binding protein